MKSGKRKSFSGPGKSATTNPKPSCFRGGSGPVGRATQPNAKPAPKKGNP